MASAGASNPNSTAEGANTFYTLLQDSDAVLSYFETFANAGATSISVIKERDLDRCQESDIIQAAADTGLNVESYYVLNQTWSVQQYAKYLNSLTSDTILVCSRQVLCEGVKLALNLESVSYSPKGKNTYLSYNDYCLL